MKNALRGVTGREGIVFLDDGGHFTCLLSLNVYNGGVKYYVINRKRNGESEVVERQSPPRGWDDSEEDKLTQLAVGASELAYRNSLAVDRGKARLHEAKLIRQVISSKV